MVHGRRDSKDTLNKINGAQAPKQRREKMKEKKKSHQIQFKPSVHAKSKRLAQKLGISFQELLERLILNAVGETNGQ